MIGSVATATVKVSGNVVTMSVSDLSDFLTGCPDCEIYAEENGKLRHELGIKDRQLEWNRYIAFGLGIGLGYLITR